MPEATEYRPSRTRMIVLSAILLLFDIGYVWMLLRTEAKPDERVFGIVGLLLFGPAFVATLFPIFRPQARLVLDADGIAEWGHFGGENMRLAWSEIARVEPFRWRVVPMLAVIPISAEDSMAKMTPSAIKASRGNERTYGYPFVLDARLYRIRSSDLAEAIGRWLVASAAPTVPYPRPQRSSAGNIPR